MTPNGNAYRLALTLSTALAAILPQSALAAQAAPGSPSAPTAAVNAPSAQTSADRDPAVSVGEIVVTGTRVKRDGYSAPTPETVVSAESIAAAAPANLADFVNDLPAVSGSSTPRTATQNVSSASAGSNFLNLRGLGATRTLVLLDGRRVVGANAEGLVDANTLPTALVSRVDVITGGASAAYGSDAVSGVVNFVLDTRFTGVKGLIQTGATTHGDNAKWRAELSAGAPFAGGRGHFLLSGSYSDSKGQTFMGSRDWFVPLKFVPNPAFAAGNGQPTLMLASNANVSQATLGGLITSGVLRGTSFGQGGVQQPFIFGTPAGSAYTIGGTESQLQSYYQLEIPLEQTTLFGRVSYDLSDAARLFFEGSYSKAIADSQGVPNVNLGNLTIQRDNAFLPDNLRAQLTAAGQTSFSYGLFSLDIGRQNPHNVRELQRFVAGVDGDLGRGWSYSAYAQYGKTDVTVDVRRNQINANFRRAIDAVRDGSGRIVCRVNQTTVTDPGCAPYNPFGIGVNSPDAIGYVSGTSSLRQQLEQQVASASLQGAPFSTWAGPVSIVVGAEYRKESVDSQVDALSLASAFTTGNYKPTIGSYDITEGFAEIVAPLAKDLPWLYNLEINGAIRRTDYSTSGGATTWKLGLNWSPIESLRFRSTYSRDIRAPNLNELFQGGVTSGSQTVTDRLTGAQTTNITAITLGNLGLAPEVAKSLTAGVVYQPDWLPGLSLSADYYDIEIEGSIVSLGTQQVVDRCVGGNTQFCADITRNSAGTITTILRRPRNFAEEHARGVDIEASYVKELADWNSNLPGRLTARVLATHFITRTVDDGLTVDEAVGENSGALPDWRVQSSIGYDAGAFGAVLTARSVSSGVYDNAFTSAVLADNSIKGATYFDLGLVYRFVVGGARTEAFLNADNVFDKDPVLVAPQTQQFAIGPVNAALYDTLGREIRVGVRFRF